MKLSPSTNDPAAVSNRIMESIRRNAREYYPAIENDRLEVKLKKQAIRINSQVYEFELSSGDKQHGLIAKIPFAPQEATRAEKSTEQEGERRPRLYPKANPCLKGLHEYRALDAIAQHFAGDRDRRFGFIRVFDLIDDPYTLVMEKSRDTNFRSQILKAHRFARRPNWETLQLGFEHAGAWLREFHSLDSLEHTESRHQHAQDYCQAVERFTDYLKQTVGRSKFFNDVRECLCGGASRLLPGEIPNAICHGDFAPRNVLLNSAGRVTVFDTGGRWQAPIYEDIAHFLTAFRGSQIGAFPTSLLYNQARIAECESRFLSGYFPNQRIPRDSIRLFECQLILDRWSAKAFRAKKSLDLQGFAFSGLAARYLRNAMKRLSR